MRNGGQVRAAIVGGIVLGFGVALLPGCSGGSGGGEVPESESVEATQRYVQNPFGDPNAPAVSDEFQQNQPPK